MFTTGVLLAPQPLVKVDGNTVKMLTGERELSFLMQCTDTTRTPVYLYCHFICHFHSNSTQNMVLKSIIVKYCDVVNC